MYRAETRFWWFVGKGRLVEDLVSRWLDLSGVGVDVGCGCGGNLDLMRGKGSWIGLDSSPEALRFCSERGHRLLALGDAVRLPFGDGSLSSAAALDVVEHLPRDGLCAREIFRALRPGGRLLVTAPAYRRLWSSHDQAVGHLRRYSLASLESLFVEAGFSVLWKSHFMFLLFPLMAPAKVWRRFFGDDAETMSYDWPGWINRVFLFILDFEIFVLKTARAPFGTTLVMVLEKPSGKELGA